MMNKLRCYLNKEGKCFLLPFLMVKTKHKLMNNFLTCTHMSTKNLSQIKNIHMKVTSSLNCLWKFALRKNKSDISKNSIYKA